MVTFFSHIFCILTQYSPISDPVWMSPEIEKNENVPLLHISYRITIYGRLLYMLQYNLQYSATSKYY